MIHLSKSSWLTLVLIFSFSPQGIGSSEKKGSLNAHSDGPERCYNDSTFLYFWDLNSGTWIASQSTLFDYLQDGRIRYASNRSWSSNDHQWISVSRKSYLYGQFFGPDYIYLLVYNSGAQRWDTASRQVFSYLPDGKTDTATYQTYGTVSTWNNIERNIYAYESNHQVLYQHESFNSASGTWQFSYRFLYSYTEDLQTGFVRQYWDTISLTWINEYRKIYSYDSQQHLAIDLLENFDEEDSVWKPQTRITYSYADNGYLAEERYESWYDTLWKYSADYLYYKDEQGYDTLILFRIWQAPDQWMVYYRYYYSYDDCGNLVKETGQYTDEGTWINDYQFVLYYSPLCPPLSVEIMDSSVVSCYGSQDGTATAFASGGSPPYTYLWDDDNGSTTASVSGLAGNRLYHVILSDAAGDMATDSVFINEPLPVITGPVMGDTLVQPGEIHSYHVNPHPGSVYVWEINGGHPVEETYGPEIDVCWREEGTLTVTVTETDSSGCSGDPSTLVVYSGTTLRTTTHKENVYIYPNPVTETLFIHHGSHDRYDLQLFGPYGNKIISKRGIYSGTSLQCSFLAPGIYFLCIKTQEKNTTFIIIKR